MAKRHFDKGTDTLLTPAFAPGEHLVVAVRGVNKRVAPRSTSDLRPPAFGPRGLLRSALNAPSRPSASKPVTHRGTAETVPGGEVLVALTDVRFWIFRRNGVQVLAGPVAFEPAELRSISYRGKDMCVTIEFDDRSLVTIFLGTSINNHAEALIELGRPLVAQARPPEVHTPLPEAERLPPGDWLASPPEVVAQTAQFTQTHPPTSGPTDTEDERP